MPDFRTRTPAIDPMALANILQRKSQIDQAQENYQREHENDRFDNILKAVQAGQTIASNMLTLAEKRNEQKGIKDLTDLVASPEPVAPAPTASSSALSDKGTFSVQPSPEQIQNFEAAKQQRQKDFMDALIRANPKQVTEEIAKQKFAANTAASADRYQQSALQITGPDGRPVTVATTFDKVTGQQINPLTGKPIVTEEDAKGLLQRGYAQGTRAAGYTSDGREVFADSRSGRKYTIEVDENGTQKQIDYTERIYPKLENPPATFTQSIAELSNAQELLVNISKSFDPKYVGPVAARAGKMSQYVGALTENQKVEFYGNVAEYKNSIIKAITGAQMSEVEAKRIVQQIPNENASPQAFLAGVKRAYAMSERRIRQQEKAIARSGGVVRGEQDSPITEEQLTNLLDRKLGKLNQPVSSSKNVPTVGGTYDGKKVKSVKRIK